MTVKLVTIKYLGIQYKVQDNTTVMRALEGVGISFRHGSSCRQGICGACALMYRVHSQSEMHGALACQTLVIDGMDLMSIPHAPIQERDRGSGLAGPVERLLAAYPEVNACTECGACNEICPVGVDIQSVVRAIPQSDLSHVVSLTSSCVNCGLCALRCPVNIQPGIVSMDARHYIGLAVVQSTKEMNKATTLGLDASTRELDAMVSMSLENLEFHAERLRKEILLRLANP